MHGRGRESSLLGADTDNAQLTATTQVMLGELGRLGKA